MDGTNPHSDMAETQRQADAAVGSALRWTVAPLLNAQADLLAGAESTVSDWLHRRHEAVDDAKQLIARMQNGADASEKLRAQQEWMSRSFRRLQADADAFHSVTHRLMDQAFNWFPRDGWMGFPWAVARAAEETTSHAMAVTRAATRPMRAQAPSE